MGCQNSKTIEAEENINNNKIKNTNEQKENQDISNPVIEEIEENKENKENEEIEENILIEKYSGQLIKGLDFQNSIIKSNDELIDNLRMFIPPKIQKKQNNSFVFNLNDKILTNSINIDFNEKYLIALKGFNNIEKVQNNNGKYVIYHDNIMNNDDKYIALIVKKIEGNPQMTFFPEIF